MSTCTILRITLTVVVAGLFSQCASSRVYRTISSMPAYDTRVVLQSWTGWRVMEKTSPGAQPAWTWHEWIRVDTDGDGRVDSQRRMVRGPSRLGLSKIYESWSDPRHEGAFTRHSFHVDSTGTYGEQKVNIPIPAVPPHLKQEASFLVRPPH